MFFFSFVRSISNSCEPDVKNCLKCEVNKMCIFLFYYVTFYIANNVTLTVRNGLKNVLFKQVKTWPKFFFDPDWTECDWWNIKIYLYFLQLLNTGMAWIVHILHCSWQRPVYPAYCEPWTLLSEWQRSFRETPEWSFHTCFAQSVRKIDFIHARCFHCETPPIWYNLVMLSANVQSLWDSRNVVKIGHALYKYSQV